MTCLPFVVKFEAFLRTISSQNLARLYRRRTPGVHHRPCRIAGAGPRNNSRRARTDTSRKHSLGCLRASRAGNSSPRFVHRSRRTRLRRICESISGHRWFWTVTLFGSAYLVLAALITMPFEFYLDYVQPHAAGWSKQTFPNWLKGEGVQLGVRMVVVALLIWLPYRLIAKSPRRWWLYCALPSFRSLFWRWSHCRCGSNR